MARTPKKIKPEPNIVAVAGSFEWEKVEGTPFEPADHDWSPCSFCGRNVPETENMWVATTSSGNKTDEVVFAACRACAKLGGVEW